MNIRVVIWGLLVMLLPGCSGVRVSNPDRVITVPNGQTTHFYRALSQEEKARLHDVSFPITVEPYVITSSEGCSIVGYYSSEPLEKLLEYHAADMEYWGWEKGMLCRGDEACISFRKPSKECVITFRVGPQRVQATLFIEHGSSSH